MRKVVLPSPPLLLLLLLLPMMMVVPITSAPSPHPRPLLVCCRAGHAPATKFLGGQLELDSHGYIATKPDSTETSVPGALRCAVLCCAVLCCAVTPVRCTA